MSRVYYDPTGWYNKDRTAHIARRFNFLYGTQAVVEAVLNAAMSMTTKAGYDRVEVAHPVQVSMPRQMALPIFQQGSVPTPSLGPYLSIYRMTLLDALAWVKYGFMSHTGRASVCWRQGTVYGAGTNITALAFRLYAPGADAAVVDTSEFSIAGTSSISLVSSASVLEGITSEGEETLTITAGALVGDIYYFLASQPCAFLAWSDSDGWVWIREGEILMPGTYYLPKHIIIILLDLPPG
jgi:hypothetical protein